MGKFDKILICTDLDGTLFRNDKTISSKNIKAIEYFKSEGGFFTFVTGRMPLFSSHVAEIIKPNAPFGCINGAGLFDVNKNDYIWTKSLSDGYKELIKEIDEKFQNVGIQVNTFYKAYFCKDNKSMERFRKLTGAEHLVRNYNNFNEPIAKVLFGSEYDEEILEIEKTLKAHPVACNFDFIRSEKNLYEILPKDTGKGTTIKKLCEHLNIDRNNTIAIGDYNNDISMLKEAKIGIAVSNACDDVIKAADYITVSNEESAIAKVIEDLDNNILKII